MTLHPSTPALPPAYPDRAAWGTARRLRAWQAEAVGQYFADLPRDFIAVATPGAGKTTFALTVAAELLDGQELLHALTPVGATTAPSSIVPMLPGPAMPPALRIIFSSRA